MHHRNRLEKFTCIFHGHIEHFINRFSLIFDLKSLTIVTFPVALIAHHIDIGKEMHLHFNETITLTMLTAAAFYVKAKTPRLITSCPCFWRAGKELTNGGKKSGVSSGI